MREVEQRTEKTTVAEKIGGLIDGAWMAISPQRGIARISARRMWRIAERRFKNSAFEGAENDRLRADRWMGSRLSPDAALVEDLETLRHRSREIYRNDTLGGVIDNRVNHIVGTGFTFQSRIRETAGVVNKARAESLNQQIESAFNRVARRIDRTRKLSLWQVCRLAQRCIDVDGELVAVMSDVGDAESLIPLAIEVIDADRLESPPGEVNNPKNRMGIEYDDAGRIVAYHVRKANPFDPLTVQDSLKYDRIDASRVVHVFERWFPQQSRGLPWLTRVLNKTRDAKDLDEAEIIACQVQACYAAFVKGGMGARGAAGAASGTNGGLLEQDIRPGSIKYLSEGQEVSFGAPSRPGNTFAPFMEWIYRRIAGGVNWSYEMMVKNWNGLSFAGGRLALIDAKKESQCRQKLIDEQFLTAVGERIITEIVVLGEVDISPREFERNKHVFTAHSWTPPRWEFAINPQQEVAADIAEINANLVTKAEKIAERGGDLEEVFAERAKERQAEEMLGIEPPTDLPAFTQQEVAENQQNQPEPAGAAA